MKDKLIQAYMDTAERFAELSHARRLHVGAIVVKDDRIISIGYNGMPAGWDNNCEDKDYMDRGAGGWLDPEEIYERWPFEENVELIDPDDGVVNITQRYRLKTKPEVLHAESNAIAKLAKSSESGRDASIFITHAPCINCAKLIYQSGISSVYYRNSYRDLAGVEFLTKSGIEVTKTE
jgi:dCMP deaminase